MMAGSSSVARHSGRTAGAEQDFREPGFKGQPIRRTLLLILLVTLLPLAVLTAVQGVARVEQDRNALQKRLSDAALLTAYSEQNVIKRAESILAVLGSSADIVDAPTEACNRRLAEVRDTLVAFSHFSVIGPDGRIRCASNPDAIGESIVDWPFWSEITIGTGYTITAPLAGRYSGKTVIWTVRRLQAPDGSFAGAITGSIDLEELRRLLRARQASNDAMAAVVDGAGRPIVSSFPLHWERLPISGIAGKVHVIDGPDGHPWALAESPLHVGTRPENTLNLVYAAQRPELLSSGNQFLVSHFALPIVALITASAGIWLGTNRAILRWIADLRSIASEVGRGEYKVPVLQFAGAPAEVRGLAAELRRMARLIARRDRTLQKGIHQQKALTHELHHRVRNNLQVIGSFLALRESLVRDPAATLALSEARLHVGLLGAVYRLLYDGGELSPVRLDRLVEAILPLLRRELKTDIHFTADGRAAQASVDIDSAIPVALWSLQALLLLSEPGPQRQPPIEGRLAAIGDEAVLSFACPDHRHWDDDPISARMLDGLARQIGGSASEPADSTGQRTITLRWALTGFRDHPGPDHPLSSGYPAALPPSTSSKATARSSQA
jgi:two-component sensor histidine kinase